MIAYAPPPPPDCEFTYTSSIIDDTIKASVRDYQRQWILSPIEQSITLSMTGRGVVNRINSLLQECGDPGWDGYDAEPVSQLVAESAIKLIKALPAALREPTVSAEPDGHISLEWYTNPYRVLSVSIGENEEFYYAALDGRTSSLKGVELNATAAAARITDILRRLNLA